MASLSSEQGMVEQEKQKDSEMGDGVIQVWVTMRTASTQEWSTGDP